MRRYSLLRWRFRCRLDTAAAAAVLPPPSCFPRLDAAAVAVVMTLLYPPLVSVRLRVAIRRATSVADMGRAPVFLPSNRSLWRW